MRVNVDICRFQGKSYGETEGQSADFSQIGISTYIQQSDTTNKFVFEDDHYRQWRFIRQFRDVANKNKFLDFKTFRHRPNK
jgi:hypothetical protein